ncbi:MAG: hypothetical protein WA162_00835 [Thermodesulfobacteriota bacterium]
MSGDYARRECGATVVLTPSESKRLIAKAVKEMSEVKKALKDGVIIIIGGTTNAFVVEELTGREFHKFWFAAGRITHGEFGANEPGRRIKPLVIRKGVLTDEHPGDALKGFTGDDVYIKGANAVDSYGCAGVLMSSDTGGAIGAAMGILNARGSSLIVPVGLEKLVPSVVEASRHCGQGRFRYSTGDPVGMMPLVNARVVTEIDSIEMLFPDAGLNATHIAGGGVNGSEGSVALSIEGRSEAVKKAFDYILGIKGEKAVTA